jgi:ABC-type multidrug transport system fused ATPase/permease subunit
MIETARKILKLLPDERWRLVWIAVAIVLTGLVQTVGIASIMPFLAVVANPSIVTSNPYMAAAYETLGFQSTESFIVALGVFFLVAMASGNALSTFTSWVLVRFQWRTFETLSNRLLAKYLKAPYQYHLDHSSSRLRGVLMGSVSKVSSGLVLPCSRILARGVSSAFIVVLLVAVDPLLALLIAGLIGGFYATIYTSIRKRQGLLGEEVARGKTERRMIASEAFGGIKELKVLGREENFLTRFAERTARDAWANSKNALVGLVPGFLLQTVTYGGVVAVILYLLQTRESLDQVFPLLALYAFGANRLLPGVQEIFAALTALRFQGASLDELLADLSEMSDADVVQSSQGPTGFARPIELPSLTEGIRLERVTFRYPKADRPALSEVTLEIPVNRTVALVGETGSGKTTLVDLLLGLFEPDAGRILVDDVVLDASVMRAWRQKVGYVPQSIFLCDASIAENIALGIPSGQIDHDAVRAAAQTAHLDTFVASLRDGYATVVGERGVRLSGGQRQRIGIARALYHNPEVLIMDEATSALDNVTEDIVMQAINELAQHRTILLIAHRLTTVQEADLIYMMDQGRVVAQGTYDDLVEKNPAFRAMARVSSWV